MVQAIRITPHPEFPVLTITNPPAPGPMVYALTRSVRPIPMPRPRNRMLPGGRFAVYNPATHQIHACRVWLRTVFEGRTIPLYAPVLPVAVSFTFRIRRPNSHFQGGDRMRPLRPEFRRRRVGAGDLDNFAKFILDAMNGVLFHDDSQVTSLTVCKLWDEDADGVGSTTIVIQEDA